MDVKERIVRLVADHALILSVLSQAFVPLRTCGYYCAVRRLREMEGCVVIDFKDAQLPKSGILHAVFFYVRYAVSYRDLKEIMAELGVRIDHATLNQWIVRYAPLIAARAQAKKFLTAIFWRMDET